MEELTPQELLFSKYYAETASKSIAAYEAGYCNKLKNKVKYEKLKQNQITNLKRAATRALKKEIIRDKIQELSTVNINDRSIAKYDEVFQLLSIIVRKTMDNLSNINTVKMSDTLKAIEIFFKWHPSLNIGKDKKIEFYLGIDDSELKKQLEEAKKKNETDFN